MASSKCPHCQASMKFVNVEKTQIQSSTGAKVNGVSYFCPGCRAVLSVAIDPASLKAEIVREVTDAIKTWK